MSDENVRPQDVPEGAITPEKLPDSPENQDVEDDDEEEDA